jgi:hypothetical protein
MPVFRWMTAKRAKKQGAGKGISGAALRRYQRKY